MVSVEDLITWAIVLGVLFGLAQVTFSNFVIIVRHSEAVVLERFQKFDRVLDSGWHWKIPLIVRLLRLLLLLLVVLLLLRLLLRWWRCCVSATRRRYACGTACCPPGDLDGG